MLVAMALVQLMTPGLAFFYGGLVKETSVPCSVVSSSYLLDFSLDLSVRLGCTEVLTMMMQNYASMGAASIIWSQS